MKSSTRSPTFRHAAFSLALVATLLLLGGTPAEAETRNYVIDKVHSTVMFKVGHLGVSWTYGRFNDFTGTFCIDDADLSKAKVEIDISAETVDTANEGRDKHLRNPDFFNVEKHPSIAFKSTSVTKADAKTYRVVGNFTLLGVTKPITLRMEKVGEGKGPYGKYRMGFEGQVVIKRSDYGMNKMLDMIGDDVHITLAIEGIRQ
jgi:polyisoprenoid-binding protein YceI